MILPCNIEFAVHNLYDYKPQDLTFQVDLDMVIRVKCFELDNKDELMEYLANSLNLMLNGEEIPISNLTPTIEKEVSQTQSDQASTSPDMLKLKIRRQQ